MHRERLSEKFLTLFLDVKHFLALVRQTSVGSCSDLVTVMNGKAERRKNSIKK